MMLTMTVGDVPLVSSKCPAELGWPMLSKDREDKLPALNATPTSNATVVAVFGDDPYVTVYCVTSPETVVVTVDVLPLVTASNCALCNSEARARACARKVRGPALKA